MPDSQHYSVRELIEKLQTLPQGAIVTIWSHEEGYMPVEFVVFENKESDNPAIVDTVCLYPDTFSLDDIFGPKPEIKNSKRYELFKALVRRIREEGIS